MGPVELHSFAALVQQKRVQYAGYEMQFWNVAANAEQLHRRWLEKLVADDSVISLVVDQNRAVCVRVSVRHDRQDATCLGCRR